MGSQSPMLAAAAVYLLGMLGKFWPWLRQGPLHLGSRERDLWASMSSLWSAVQIWGSLGTPYASPILLLSVLLGFS